MVKAVIFDMDGVLIDTEKWLNKYWRIAAQEAGFQMEREHALAIRSLAGEYAAPYLQGIFGENFDYHKIRERRKALMAEHIARYGIEKKDGVDELLDYLEAHGIRRAVATATDQERTKEYLTQIGVCDRFDAVICATMVAHGKPQPDIYRYACEQLGERPEDCIAIEDSPNGVRSAAGAGIPTIMVRDLTGPDPETERLLLTKADSLFDVILYLAS